MAAFLVAFAVFAWWPGAWLFLVPASLPLLNLSPWTGWLIFEEFDVLLLAVAAGGYARLAFTEPPEGAGKPARWSTSLAVSAALFALVSAIALQRGFVDAGGFSFGWFQGYVEPLNSLRVAKSLWFALLLVPLVRAEVHACAPRAVRCVGAGMLAGLAVVALAVLWERWAMPGLWNFSSRYRTVAMFWEMHVGGAALDGYLALAAPFAVWGLASARTPARFAVAGLLALLVAYACLTTFSRGLYLAATSSLVLLGILAWMARPHSEVATAFARRLLWAGAAVMAVAVAVVVAISTLQLPVAGFALLLLGGLVWMLWRRPISSSWRWAAWRGLGAALLIEVLVVVAGGTFLMERMSRSEQDLQSRYEHWRRGVGLLYSASDWIAGIGLGRLPANYARFAPGHEFSGAVRLNPMEAGRRSVRVSGPPSRAELEGMFALTQRVPIGEGASYEAEFDVRVEATTVLSVSVCEMHLLYDQHCQGAFLRVRPGKSSWQHTKVALSGPPLSRGDWFASRLGVFAISVAAAGTAADIANLRLHREQAQLLSNSDFSEGLAHWFPAAQSYFLPWHIDNLFLELLVERGVAGLLCFLAMIGIVLWRLVAKPNPADTLRPILAASLCGALSVGLVSSLMDVPRVAFLLFFLICLAAALDSALRTDAGHERPDR